MNPEQVEEVGHLSGYNRQFFGLSIINTDWKQTTSRTLGWTLDGYQHSIRVSCHRFVPHQAYLGMTNIEQYSDETRSRNKNDVANQEMI